MATAYNFDFGPGLFALLVLPLCCMSAQAGCCLSVQLLRRGGACALWRNGCCKSSQICGDLRLMPHAEQNAFMNAIACQYECVRPFPSSLAPPRAAEVREVKCRDRRSGVSPEAGSGT